MHGVGSVGPSSPSIMRSHTIPWAALAFLYVSFNIHWSLLLVNPSGRGTVLICFFLNFLFLPLTTLFINLLYTFVLVADLCQTINRNTCGLNGCYWKRSKCYGGRLLMTLIIILELLVILPLGLCCAVVVWAMVLLPTYIIQGYRLGKTIGLWCCKTNDRHKPERRTSKDSDDIPEPWGWFIYGLIMVFPT